MTKIEELAIDYYRADRELNNAITSKTTEKHMVKLDKAFKAKKALFKEIEANGITVVDIQVSPM
jgi:hypothetical protein